MHRIDHLLYSKLDHLPSIARQLLAYAGSHRIWLLEGGMGVGKTTLIKAICQQLGVQDHVTSPTFSLVNEYAMTSGERVYHFDFYRLENEEEAYQIGIEEYFYSGNVCMLEWPQRIEGLLPDSFLRIDITERTDQSRMIKLTMHG